MTTEFWTTAVPVSVTVNCTSCKGLVALDCANLGGTVMYETYNEFACPRCRKLNYAKTPGHINAVRLG